MNKEQIENNTVEQYRNTAVAVYNYLASLPDTLARSIYKQIVHEAYDIASCYPVQQIIPQLAEAISRFYNINSSEEANLHLSKYLGVDPYTLTRIIYNKEELEQTLQASRWESLPPADNLLKAFECFSFLQTPVNAIYIDIWERLDKMMEPSQDEKQPVHPMYINCFYKLGYLTALFNNEKEQNDELIFHWFCKGNILDIVFKNIWDNCNQQIATALYENLMAACKNLDLARICDKRYNIVRKTRSGWPFEKFEQVDSVGNSPIPALGWLIKKVTDKNMEEYCNKCTDLYYDLVDKGFINKEVTNETAFVNIFMNRKEVHPIVWVSKNSYSLSSFAKCLYKKTALFYKYDIANEFWNHFSLCINTHKNYPGSTIKDTQDKEPAKEYDSLFEDMLNRFN